MCDKLKVDLFQTEISGESESRQEAVETLEGKYTKRGYK